MPTLIRAGHRVDDQTAESINLAYMKNDESTIKFVDLYQMLFELFSEVIQLNDLELYIYSGDAVERFRESINQDFPEEESRQ